ncbi:MAG: hypothetical protein DRH70_02775 [Candidatus Coatesbacteria bacterium]|nr:MAG: hypothetical protein DRH70_02775 [Candidatus Coatesbacteria bacterium]
MSSVKRRPGENTTAFTLAAQRSAQPKVSIVVINYNTGSYLRRCVASVLKFAPNAEIVIWDNASSDDSLVLQSQTLETVRLIRSPRNVGFARAVNAAVKACSGEFILLLNPDTEARSDFVSPLVNFIERHGRRGIVGGKVVNPDGSLEKACRRAIPTPTAALLRLTGISLLFPNSRRLPLYNLPDSTNDRAHKVGAVSGSFCMFPRELAKRVPFDEQFFLFGEDLDFCLRASKLGESVWFVPFASVIHQKGVSMRRRPIFSLLCFYDSMLKFYKKHFASRHSLAFNFVVFIAIWALAFPKMIFRLVVLPIQCVLKSLEG